MASKWRLALLLVAASAGATAGSVNAQSKDSTLTGLLGKNVNDLISSGFAQAVKPADKKKLSPIAATHFIAARSQTSLAGHEGTLDIHASKDGMVSQLFLRFADYNACQILPQIEKKFGKNKLTQGMKNFKTYTWLVNDVLIELSDIQSNITDYKSCALHYTDCNLAECDKEKIKMRIEWRDKNGWN